MEPDLNHPGLDLTAVSAEVDLGPERDPDHFGHGHNIHRLAAVAAGLPDNDEEVT